MFERFTQGARQVVVLAQEEARILRHDYIGIEHIVLGILREDEGLPVRVLQTLGVTIERFREGVERLVPAIEDVGSGQIPFAPEAKKVLELSLREALAVGHNYIGPEHILLGVARANEGITARILAELDADSDEIRQRVMSELADPVGQAPVPRAGPPWAPSHEQSGFPDTLIEGATWLITQLALEIEERLERPADAGDLLVALSCIGDGLAARTFARLGLEPESILAAVEEARRDGTRPRFLPPAELVAETERVRREKEAKIEASEFEDAANLRDLERRLVSEARDHEEQRLHAILAEVRGRLGLA